MKKCLAVFLVICLLCSSFVFAQEQTFDVIPYDFEIFWNGAKMDTNSPVLLINGETYVPLRDMAKEIGMDVNWDGENKEIRLTETGFWFEDVFFDALGFNLPQTAEVVNYTYARYGRDISLHAKIFFEENDLDYIKNELDNIANPLSLDEINEFNNTVISNISKKFDWWDISSAKYAQYAYFGFMEGIEVTTIDVWALICKVLDSDGYYLYISH